MLSPAAATAVQAALTELRAATARIEKAAADASGGFAGWWASTIGADSTTAAMRSQAAAAQSLLTVMEGKARALTSDAAADDFVRVVGEHTDTSGIEAVRSFLSPAGAVREVGGDTVRDLAGVAVGVGEGWLSILKASPYIMAALALVWLWSWLPKRKARP
ncbi:MAG: hypothetical protein IPO08_21760 [Xanthomonadales bacterium]|nr:hypothetical protein [Xanthomonadales bacterium]